LLEFENISEGFQVTAYGDEFFNDAEIEEEEQQEMVQVNTQVNTQVSTQVENLLLKFNEGSISVDEIQKLFGLKERRTFARNYIQPALKLGLIEMTIPDKPNSRLQKYRLTEKGKELKNKI